MSNRNPKAALQQEYLRQCVLIWYSVDQLRLNALFCLCKQYFSKREIGPAGESLLPWRTQTLMLDMRSSETTAWAR